MPLRCFSRLKVFLWGDSFAQASTFLGLFLMNIPIGASAYYGNLMTYTDSYLKIRLELDPSQCASITMATYNISWSLALIVYRQGMHCLGDRLSFLTCALAFDLSIFAAGHTVQYSVVYTEIVLGACAGLASGSCQGMVLTYFTQWAPTKERQLFGMVVGLAVTTSVTAILPNSLITWYLNPDNLGPSAEETLGAGYDEWGDRVYFTQEEILDRIPSLFTLMGSSFLVLHLVGLILLRTRPGSAIGKAEVEVPGPPSATDDKEDEQMKKDGEADMDGSSNVKGFGNQKFPEEGSLDQDDGPKAEIERTSISSDESSESEDSGLSVISQHTVNGGVTLGDKESLEERSVGQGDVPEEETEGASASSNEASESEDSGLAVISHHSVWSELSSPESRLSSLSLRCFDSLETINEDSILPSPSSDISLTRLNSSMGRYGEIRPNSKSAIFYIEEDSTISPTSSEPSSVFSRESSYTGSETTKIEPFVEIEMYSVFDHVMWPGLQDLDESSDEEIELDTNSLYGNYNVDVKQEEETAAQSSALYNDVMSIWYLIKQKEFIAMWLGTGSTFFSLMTLETYYKMSSQSRVPNDWYLSSLGSALQLFIFMGRLGWPELVQKLGIKNGAVIFLAMNTLCMGFAFLAPNLDQYVLLPLICLCGLAVSGMYGVYPIAVSAIFGTSQIPMVYGLTTMATILASACFPIVMDTGITWYGWPGVFLIPAWLSLMALVLNVGLLPGDQ